MTAVAQRLESTEGVEHIDLAGSILSRLALDAP
jgi:hypothetical protein